MPGTKKEYKSLPAFRHESKYAPGRDEDEYWVWDPETGWECFGPCEKEAEKRYYELMDKVPIEPEVEMTEEMEEELKYKLHEIEREMREQQSIRECDRLFNRHSYF